MKKTTIITGIVLLALIAVAVMRHKAPEKAVTAEQDATAVEVMTAETKKIESYIDATGSLTAKYSADVRAEASGVIREVFVSDWVAVKKGQALARIDSEELRAAAGRAEASVKTAQAQYMEAKTYMTRAERELTRVKNLKESGLATSQQLDDAVTEADAAKAKTVSAQAQIKAAQEELNQINVKISRTNIVSPINGTIAARNANVGDMAGGENSAALFTIIDESVYDLNVQIPTVDISGISVGGRVDFTVDAYPDRVFTGKVAHINPQVNTGDRAVSVNITVPNDDRLLKAGFFVKAKIYTGVVTDAILIPQTALIGNDVTAHTAKVYVAKDGIAEMKEVKTGRTGGGNVQILSGLADGEQVIFRGSFTVKNGGRIQVAK
ncbi:MAG: efflux RND transporter periplasmic adaptor subunit [Deferribacterales bacterium]